MELLGAEATLRCYWLGRAQSPASPGSRDQVPTSPLVPAGLRRSSMVRMNQWRGERRRDAEVTLTRWKTHSSILIYRHAQSINKVQYLIFILWSLRNMRELAHYSANKKLAEILLIFDNSRIFEEHLLKADLLKWVHILSTMSTQIQTNLRLL